MPEELQKGLGAVLRAQDDINRRIKQLFANLQADIEIIQEDGAPLSDSNPAPLGTTSPGVGTSASRFDHVHAHGNLAGGSLHATAVASVSAGFISAADQAKLDGLSAGLTTGQTLAIANFWPLP